MSGFKGDTCPGLLTAGFWGAYRHYFFLLETGDQMREKGAENANCLKKTWNFVFYLWKCSFHVPAVCM